MQDVLLARMFFRVGGDNLHIETRPLKWIEFVSAEDLASQMVSDESRDEFIEQVDRRTQGGKEVFIAITDNLLGVQMFRGTFNNVRQDRKHSHARRDPR